MRRPRRGDSGRRAVHVGRDNVTARNGGRLEEAAFGTGAIAAARCVAAPRAFERQDRCRNRTNGRHHETDGTREAQSRHSPFSMVGRLLQARASRRLAFQRVRADGGGQMLAHPARRPRGRGVGLPAEKACTDGGEGGMILHVPGGCRNLAEVEDRDTIKTISPRAFRPSPLAASSTDSRGAFVWR